MRDFYQIMRNNMTDNNSHIASSSSFTPSDWVETTLGEVCEIKGGKRLPKGENLVSHKTNHPYIRITDLENNQIKKNQLQFVTDEVFQSISRYIVHTGDVIVSIVGSIGFVALIDEDLNNASLTENCVKLVNLKNLDSKFLYYFLISRDGQAEIAKNTVGAVQKKLPIYGVQNIKISLPPLPEQQAIASVLSAVDDKIDLLREQNKTLEEMGQVIFQEWFGKYGVDDELPDGWRVGKLGEVGQIVCGKTPSKENQEYFGGEIPFIKIPDMHGEVFIVKTEDSLTKIGANTQKNKFIPKNSICVSCIATVGLVSITSKDSQTNQQINSIVPNDEKYLEYLYFVLTNMKSDLLAIGRGGSATLNINTSIFSNIKIIIPNEEIINNFHNTTTPLFTKILDNLYQIHSLARNRDELLPKLMRGEVRVEF